MGCGEKFLPVREVGAWHRVPGVVRVQLFKGEPFFLQGLQSDRIFTQFSAQRLRFQSAESQESEGLAQFVR